METKEKNSSRDKVSCLNLARQAVLAQSISLPLDQFYACLEMYKLLCHRLQKISSNCVSVFAQMNNMSSCSVQVNCLLNEE